MMGGGHTHLQAELGLRLHQGVLHLRVGLWSGWAGWQAGRQPTTPASTHSALRWPLGLLQLSALGPQPWAPAQAHVATHRTGGLPAERPVQGVVVDGIPQCCCV